MAFLATALKLKNEPGKREGLWSFPLIWKEKRYALKTSRKLLKTYLALKSDHPDLQARELYEMVVAEHKSIAIAEARQIVDQAEESFASWPIERDVRFRDVVRFIIVSEFMHSNELYDGLGPHFGEVVERAIPYKL